MSWIYIRVTAPPGRSTPVHTEDGCEPGGDLLVVVSGKMARVRMSQTIRRSIARGDLIPCDADGSRVGVGDATWVDLPAAKKVSSPP